MSVRQLRMNYAAACQLCKTPQPGKPYVRCYDCEIFLCSQCDYAEHCSTRENRSLQQNTGTHKRVRICEECEEQECATQCHSCEQVLCLQCSNRLHQKGARQKHKRYPINQVPDLIRPEKSSKSGGSSVDNSNIRNQDKKQSREVTRELVVNDDRDNSQISRKNSDDPTEEYYTEEDPYLRTNQYEYRSASNYNQQYYKGDKSTPTTQSSYNRQQQEYYKQERGYYNSNYTDKSNSQTNSKNYYQQREGGRQVMQNDGDYHNKSTQNTRGTKGSGCYSSGGSSAGSHHNSYSTYNRGHNDDSYYQGGSHQHHHNYNNHQYSRPQNKPHQINKKYQGSNNASNHNSSYYQHHRENQNQQYQMSSQFGRGHSNSGRRGKSDQIVIPVWQPLVKCEGNQKEMFIIQKELFDFAQKGELLIESNLFIGVIADSLQISESECQRLIESAVSQKIIHQTTRNFMKMKTLVFLSPKLDIISHECICWAMQSLKRDEMTPTEKTLQNRIKEAFAFKISTSLWEVIIQSLESTDYKQSTNYKNKLQITLKGNKTKSSTQYKDNQYNDSNDEQNSESLKEQFTYPDKKGITPPQFKVKDIEEDPSIGQMTKAVYMKDEEEWLGVDQNIDNVNYILYDELKSFLQEYFCSHDADDDESNTIQQNDLSSNKSGGIKFNHTQTTTDQDFEEVRAIAGGRYGCAQFVKLCGPQNLRQCSLGRLAQLVQYAVKEDVLRYHKTLLVWTTSVDKHKRLAEELQKKSTQNAAIAAKLDVVKTSLIEILAESKSGMSLAQLPLYLRRKLPFQLDLNELGFPKLKDLILSMSDKIKLELKGHNHPFAYLVKSGRYVHSTSNSDDFQSIPKSKTFIKQGHPNLSEDLNFNRHLKNTLHVDEEDIQNVLTAFYNIMREIPMGVESDQLPSYLGKKLNKEFNVKNYGCNSLLEFMKKYVIPTMDIEIIYNDVNHNEVYLLRSREVFMSYTYQQIKAHQMQQMEKEKQLNVMNQQLQQMSLQQNKVAQNLQVQQKHQQMQRQDSGSSSLNISSQCYVPNHQSLYGSSTSANTSTQQINVSHIRFNTADTLEMQGQQFPRNEIHSINPNINPFSKPPKHPQINTNQNNQFKPQVNQQMITQQKQVSSFKTFPPVQLMQQQQQLMNQQLPSVQNFVKHQQSNSSATNFSLQSFVQPQQQNLHQGYRGFFLSPSHLQMNKLQLNEQHSQNQSNITSPLHSRAISFNNSAFGGQAAIQSTTSKSASQDFSIQSHMFPNQLNLKNNQIMFPQSQSGFTSPNTQANLFGGINFQSKNQGQNQVESTFGSPIPGSYRFDSIGQGHYEESPPYHDDEDDHTAKRDFRYLEKLVCDDDIDFKSGDEQSQTSFQSPQLSAVGNVGLRIPISNFNGLGPGVNITKHQYGSLQQQKKQWSSVDLMRQNNQAAAKGMMQSSSSCKNIMGGPIVEGGSSSSEENKRPSTVHEQKTEEDAEDNITSTMLLNQKWNQLMNQQNTIQPETENLLFQLSSDIQQQQQLQNQYTQQQQFHDNSSLFNQQFFESQRSQNNGNFF